MDQASRAKRWAAATLLGEPGATVVRELLSELETIERERDALKTENAQLRGWKESAQAVDREWDEQAIAKILGAKLGQRCRAVIAEKVPTLVARLAEIEAENARLRMENAEAFDRSIERFHAAIVRCRRKDR